MVQIKYSMRELMIILALITTTSSAPVTKPDRHNLILEQVIEMLHGLEKTTPSLQSTTTPSLEKQLVHQLELMVEHAESDQKINQKNLGNKSLDTTAQHHDTTEPSRPDVAYNHADDIKTGLNTIDWKRADYDIKNSIVFDSRSNKVATWLKAYIKLMRDQRRKGMGGAASHDYDPFGGGVFGKRSVETQSMDFDYNNEIM